MFGLESWIASLISYELTIVGFMLASISFLAREFLSEERKIILSDRANPFFMFILSLLTVSILLIGVATFVVALSDIQLSVKIILLVVTLAPSAPITVVFALLWRE
jgi:hypothetical protein